MAKSSLQQPVLPRKKSILIEQQIPASNSPRSCDPRARTYENFREYYAELFERLIPAELKTSSINLIKRNSISAQAYERLIRHMKHWFTPDPNNKFDPADTKSKERVELLFSDWMDKTFSPLRGSFLKRQQKR